MYTPVLSSFITIYFNSAIKLPVLGILFDFTNHSVNTETYTSPTHLLESFQNGLGCTLLQHYTSHALFTSQMHAPQTKEFVCGVCIGTVQVDFSLVTPLDFTFKQSSLRVFLEMITIMWYVHLYWLSGTRYNCANILGAPPYPSCLLPCIV